MVEAANATETREQIRTRTKDKFMNIFSEWDNHEEKINEDNGNLVVR